MKNIKFEIIRDDEEMVSGYRLGDFYLMKKEKLVQKKR